MGADLPLENKLKWKIEGQVFSILHFHLQVHLETFRQRNKSKFPQTESALATIDQRYHRAACENNPVIGDRRVRRQLFKSRVNINAGP